jgi:cytochrome P450
MHYLAFDAFWGSRTIYDFASVLPRTTSEFYKGAGRGNAGMLTAEKVGAKPDRDPEAEVIINDMLASVALGRNPAPLYRRLRDKDRVFYSADRGMWFVTGYAEVEQILRSPVAQIQFASRMDRIRPNWRERPASALNEDVIAFVDGEPHQKIRKGLMPSWTASEIERQRPWIRAQAEKLVDAYIAEGGGSFHEKVSHPMAEDTIFTLFGMDESMPRHLPRLVDEFLFVHDYDATEEQLERADGAALEMREFWKAEYMKRVREPGDDMLSELARNPAFTVEEGVAIAESLYTGGFDSTALTATSGMALLATHPEELERARQDPAALDRVSDEVLRMAVAIPMTLRVAMDDISVGGHTIPAGAHMGIVLLAANRDPAVFADPERFDLTRPKARNMTFSTGVHACVGHLLARMELFEIYRAMLQRTTRIDLIGEPGYRLNRQTALGIEHLTLAVA